MKMFKKLMAVVLTGALAVSMMTGCAIGDAAKTEALVKALNTKGVQSNEANPAKANDYKFERNSSLDSKAKDVWTGTDTAKKQLNKTVPASADLNTLKEVTIGSTKYYYYMAKYTSTTSEAKKSENWTNEAKTLFAKVKESAETTTADTLIVKTSKGSKTTTVSGLTNQKNVELGAAYVSKQNGDVTDHYVIVLFKTTTNPAVAA